MATAVQDGVYALPLCCIFIFGHYGEDLHRHTIVLASAEILSSSSSPLSFCLLPLFLSILVSSAANDVIRQKQLTKRSFCTPAANLQLSSLRFAVTANSTVNS